MQLIPREDLLCLLDGQAAGCNEGTIRRKCGFSQGYSQSLPCLGPCRSGCVELESMSWMHARGPQMSGSKCRGAERWRLSVAHAGQSQGRIRLQQSAGSKLAYIALHAENADQAGSETKIEARIRYLCDGQCLLQWKNCERGGCLRHRSCAWPCSCGLQESGENRYLSATIGQARHLKSQSHLANRQALFLFALAAADNGVATGRLFRCKLRPVNDTFSATGGI